MLLGRIDGGAAEREIVVEENIGTVRLPRRHERSDPRPRFVCAFRACGGGGHGSRRGGCRRALSSTRDIGFRWSASVPLVGGIAQISCRCARSPRSRGRGPDTGPFDASSRSTDAPSSTFYCNEAAETGHDFHARMFAPNSIAEDPSDRFGAPPSPACCRRIGRWRRRAPTVRIEQGYEMAAEPDRADDGDHGGRLRGRPSAAAPWL